MADKSGETAKVNLVYEVPDSSNLKVVSFIDTGTKTFMRVFFKGSSTKFFYEYAHVSLETYTKIITAESVGGKFNELVRQHPAKYPYTKKEV